jgi:hypothetical protein
VISFFILERTAKTLVQILLDDVVISFSSQRKKKIKMSVTYTYELNLLGTHVHHGINGLIACDISKADMVFKIST